MPISILRLQQLICREIILSEVVRDLQSLDFGLLRWAVDMLSLPRRDRYGVPKQSQVSHILVLSVELWTLLIPSFLHLPPSPPSPPLPFPLPTLPLPSLSPSPHSLSPSPPSPPPPPTPPLEKLSYCNYFLFQILQMDVRNRQEEISYLRASMSRLREDLDQQRRLNVCLKERKVSFRSQNWRKNNWATPLLTMFAKTGPNGQVH